MASYQIMYWHDIPVQVRVKEGRTRVSVPLHARFQEAVDQAAMVAGLIGSDEYSELFRWGEASERPGTPDDVAKAVAWELESQFPEIDWRATVNSLAAAKE
jgi:hypothetical protein